MNRRDEDFEKVAEIYAKTFNHFILFEDYQQATNDGEISNLLKEKLLKNVINKSQVIIILNENDALLKALEIGGKFDADIMSNYNIDGTNDIVKLKK